MKKKNIFKILFLTVLTVASVIIIWNQQTTPYQHNTGFIFGTTYSITYQNNKDLQAEIEAEMNEVDAALSPFNKRSIITAVNNNHQVKLNQKFMQVFNLAENISHETDGAFDITVAPLVNEWGFGFRKGVNPTKHVIDSLRQIVGYQKVALINGKVVKKDPRINLDCSGIAKGYGSDCVANLLRRHGIENFMVEIGGEIVTAGVNPDRVPWKIGVTKPVDNPTQQNGELQTVLNVTDKAMATSGNYRNFYYKGGRKYAHTIDPKTGYPVQHNILSSTVIADNCATADAYATAFMVLGLNKAKAILQRHPELMAYFIYSDKNGKNTVWFSPSMKKAIAQ
ncbi:FAD:protein FMN transferase [Hallella multisaccharivorax DSM 17128]|uniref:FAD:protein FMN transferase n=1 Tax=Hallella multisaccharivorax DSM 17128 TaxID=688246 RepID=F8N631_9BACT|nr:FAD:protein FMN transferase [Hallella multisaccharivorax]EGN57215.1 ApbE family lipoprotein [Hallella multisaccharivorax DSM 17128]GJG31543.1 FAD:protein FMN transferase [Hallella multisaccharivorax DSM 17128]